MWTAASTRDSSRLLARAGSVALLALALLLPAVAAGDNGADKKAPKAPENLRLVGASSSSLTLGWEGSRGASERVVAAGYTLYRNQTVVATTPATTFTFDSLSCSASYTLEVDAFDAAGNHSERVQLVAETGACLPSPPPPPDTQPPTAPGSLTKGATTTTSIAIAWTASTDNVAVTGYSLYRNGAIVGSSSVTSYAFTGLICGTTYTLGAAAYDAAGNRSAVSELPAATAACLPPPPPPTPDTQPPTAPGSLTKGATTTTSIPIAWAASTDNVAVTGYSLYRNGAIVGSSSVTSYAFTGLTCGTTYRLGVAAYDAAGNRSAVSELNAATASCPPPPPTGSSFYVSPSGSDSAPGTAQAPWRTIGKAVATLTAGQTAYLRAGTYAENMGGSCTTSYNVVTWSNSGTSTAPITISGYPGEESDVVVKTKLRLTGDWLRLRNLVYDRNYAYASPVDLACTGEPLHVLGDDIAIEGLEVRNGNQSGIFLGGANRVTIEGNWIHHNGTHTNADHGIYWSSGTGGTIANNVIERNLVFGIQMYPAPVGQLIAQNTIVANGKAGIILSGASNVVVANNISAWNAEEGIRTGSGSNAGCLVDKNVLYGNSADYWWQTPLTVISTIHADPFFVNRGAGNFHLAAGSPAVDAAISRYSTSADYDGASRPFGAGPDIGAFERRA